MDILQREERRDNFRLGFGGSVPCGQTNGTEMNMLYTVNISLSFINFNSQYLIIFYLN